MQFTWPGAGEKAFEAAVDKLGLNAGCMCIWREMPKTAADKNAKKAADKEANKWAVRPCRRAPQGKAWDTLLGQWVDAPEQKARLTCTPRPLLPVRYTWRHRVSRRWGIANSDLSGVNTAAGNAAYDAYLDRHAVSVNSPCRKNKHDYLPPLLAGRGCHHARRGELGFAPAPQHAAVTHHALELDQQLRVLLGEPPTVAVPARPTQPPGHNTTSVSSRSRRRGYSLRRRG